jgi:Domain of unknown function (DUF5753)/Helix-turn-helix domain
MLLVELQLTERVSRMPIEDDPILAKRNLGNFLRKAREDAKLGREAASARAHIPDYTLLRVESAATTIKINDLRALLALYEVSNERWPELEQLAQTSRKTKSAWWYKYRKFVPDTFIEFLTYEGYAKTIRNFEPHLIPGLLQTPEYAEAITQTIVPKNQEAIVELRLERQRRFRELQEPAEAHFIIDEAVLHRFVGGAAIMRNQLQALLDMMEMHNLKIQIIPFEHGLYDRWFESYVLFEMASRELGIVLYLEDPHNDMISKESSKHTAPAEYLRAFKNVEALAARYDAGREIRRVMAGMASP